LLTVTNICLAFYVITKMDSYLKQLLDKTVSEQMEWEAASIPFAATDGQQHNLCDYMGKDCRCMGDCFFFPQKFNSCSKETRDALAKALEIASAEGKFPLVQRGWDGKIKISDERSTVSKVAH
jgi:hypothetical protein